MSFVKTILVLVGCIACAVAKYQITLHKHEVEEQFFEETRTIVFAISEAQSNSSVTLMSVKSFDGKQKFIVPTGYLENILKPKFEVHGLPDDGEASISMITEETSDNELQGVTIFGVKGEAETQSEKFQHAAFLFLFRKTKYITSDTFVTADIAPVAAYYVLDGDSATLVTVQLLEVKDTSPASATFLCKNTEKIPIWAPVLDDETRLFIGIMTSVIPGKMEFAIFDEDFLEDAGVNGNPYNINFTV